jgi:hypothetical protein
MTSKLTRLTDDELTETLRQATSGYPLPACVEGNLRQAFAELQERRKAEKDSEPVAWTDEEELRDVNVAGIGYLFGIDREANKFADPRRQIMLHRHAQPAPVVPQDVLEALQKVARIRLDLNDFDGDRRGIADCLGDAEEALIEVVNRRAAMLAASLHDTPALNSLQSVDSVAGKWIPVSERMPENDVSVLTFDGMYRRVHHAMYGHWQCWEPEKITHWMPLPNPPKGVK